MAWVKTTFRIVKWLAFGTCLLVLLAVGILIFTVEHDLPDVAVLKDVKLQVPLRIFTSDGKLIAEYGQKRRIPVPYEEIPQPLIQAVLATEDQRFYEHPGVDIFGLLRAAVRVAATGTKAQGGSTITMQVARNFFLTRKKTYVRKLKEILLAIKIDSELSKDRIISLYLNKIYFGNRAYGVGAAAQVYYGKSLRKLTLPQMAMIAGLPKAPSNLNPLKNPEAALKRRNHVLKRMFEEDYISEETYQQAIAAPVTARFHGLPLTVKAPFVAEMVRSALVEQYGEKAYSIGLSIYTTLDSKLVKTANKTLQEGLLTYDKRHGYRGSEDNLEIPRLDNLPQLLKTLKKIKSVNQLQPAIVMAVHEKDATALLKNGSVVTIPWEGLSWARKATGGRYLGAQPTSAAQILKSGDLIRVIELSSKKWHLSQIPEIEGALVSMDPQTGAIVALVGGFNYQKSNFNRATQAHRQPGSAFKPFIYSAALAKGFSLASIINDAPVVVSNPSEENYWRPQNDTRKFYGPTRLRVGLIKSRNLVSIRTLDATGIPFTLEYLRHFGFSPRRLPNTLSLALGSGAVSPLELARAYGIIANGGFKIKPYIIDYITNTSGEMIFQAKPQIACEVCIKENFSTATLSQQNIQWAEQSISPQIAYLITTALKDVIKEGTGRRVRYSGLQRDDLAGKTGTTNEQKDGWFAGFNSDLVTVAWVGFDIPKSIYEYGSKSALPIWVNFMKTALQKKPEHSMPQPQGLVTIRIDSETGLTAQPWQKNTLFETFREENLPERNQITESPYPASGRANQENLDENDEDTYLF